MARQYHSIITREDGKWSPQFGDFDKEVVKQEMEDSYRENFKAKDRKIITTGSSQKDINDAIAKLNA